MTLTEIQHDSPLRRWMAERDLSCRELARRCDNLHWTTINHICVGTRNPNHDTVRKLAQGLDMPEAQIMRAYGLT